MHSGIFRVRFYVEPWKSDSMWSSKSVICSGIFWQLQATIDPARSIPEKSIHCPTFLTIYLVATKPSNDDTLHQKDWEAEVAGVLTVVNLKNNSKNITHEFSTSVSQERPRIEFENECNCSYCADESDCCMLDDQNCITVEVNIHVKQARGFSLPPIIDFAIPTEHTDVMFMIEGRPVHVNKEEISKVVPELGLLFDTGETKIIFDGMSHNEFVEFLSVIYPSQAPISDTNFELLLAFAKKYSLQRLIDTIEEQWLIGDHYFPPTEGLILMVKYKLTRFRDWVASERRSWDDKPDVSVILDMPEYKAMSDREARQLFEACFSRLEHR